MNVQQIPGKRDAKGVFGQLNGCPIRWQQKDVLHIVEGADVHPGVRLLWTMCEIDVPADAAHLGDPGDKSPLCPRCLQAIKIREEEDREARAANSQFGVGA